MNLFKTNHIYCFTIYLNICSCVKDVRKFESVWSSALRNFAGHMYESLQTQGKFIFEANKLQLTIIETGMIKIRLSFPDRCDLLCVEDVFHSRHVTGAVQTNETFAVILQTNSSIVARVEGFIFVYQINTMLFF